MDTTTRSRIAWACLALGVLALVGYMLTPDEAVLAEFSYHGTATIGAVMLVVGAVTVRGPRRRVWLALAAGQVLWLIGDVTWSIYESVLFIEPYPSLADAAYLSRYVLVAVGLTWLVKGRRRGQDRAAFLDAAIISTGFAVVGTVFVVQPAAAGGGESLLSQIVAGAYPVGDLLLLVLLVRLLTSGAARSLSFWFLVTGLGLMLACDIPYVLYVVSGLEYPLWINPLYLIAYLVMGFSALHPSVNHLSEPTARKPHRMTALRLAALGLALALAPLTALVADITGFDAATPVLVSGALVGIILVLARMSGLLRSLQSQAVQLAALARSDSLTGAANRRTWDHELSRACAAAREHGWVLTVALIDLDHFKSYNDTHGHMMGDLVLKESVAAWNQVLAGRGFLARFGGEEFTVLLPEHTLEEAETVLDGILHSVTRDQTCSIGMAAWDTIEDPDTLVARADQALYHAKRHGRNRLAVHDGQNARDLGTKDAAPVG